MQGNAAGKLLLPSHVIHPHAELSWAKVLCSCLNSALAKYFALSARRWM